MSEEQKKADANKAIPKWLKTIQLNSWEAELLVSALVLYALFQVPDLLRTFSLRSIDADSQLQGFFRILITAVEILKIGYILHILIRGIWVSSVGLSYVFPQGINKENLKFKRKFKKELDGSTSLVKNVLRLEELSSLIYGISFLLFGSLLGFGTFTFSIIFLTEKVSPLLGDNFYLLGLFGIIFLFYIFLSLLVFIDFLTNGYFRRKNWSSDWFYPVAFFFRVVTLSFLYRRSLLVLISNTKGWKSHLIPIVIAAVIFGFIQLGKGLRESQMANFLSNAEKGNFSNMNYENLRSNDDVLLVTIQSDIVNESVLKVFLKDKNVFEKLNKKDWGSKANWIGKNLDSVSISLNKWLTVKIDDKEIEKVDWFRSQHATDYEFGFTSFIDIAPISHGLHTLKISFDTTALGERGKKIVDDEGFNFKYLSNIHFFYDKQ